MCLVITHFHGLNTFAFFCEVFKEHFISTKVLTVRIYILSYLLNCFNRYVLGIPSKLNNVSEVKPDVNDLGLEPCVSTIQISIERR